MSSVGWGFEVHHRWYHQEALMCHEEVHHR